ncbi:unnamed protein product [Ectocarpus sp. CCAP 1310/34]|nr:unnamed protein product [Ectocarpus sp. CCAP 1310/34]
MGIAVEKYPELLAVVDAMLPEGTEREDDGLGDDGGGTEGGRGETPDALRCASAKRKGQELRTDVRQQTKKLNQAKKKADAQAVTDKAMTDAMAKITPAMQDLVPKASSARLEAEEAESLSLKLQASADLTDSYLKISKLLSDEKKKGEDADEWLIGQ